MADKPGELPQEQIAPQTDSQTAPDSSEPYFSYKYADGKEEVYRTKDELSKAYRDSFLRQSDYTRKTQEVAQTKKQIEEERKAHEEEKKQFAKIKQQYDEWDRLLKTRPDLYSQLERVASAPPDPSAIYDRSKGYVDEKYQTLEQQVAEMKAQLEKDRTQKELNDTFAEFKTKYEDFDEGPIMERLELLANGETKPLIDLLYWATKGQMSPEKEAQIEEKIAGNLQKKKSAGLVSAKGTGPSPSKKNYRTLDEGRKAAYEDAGIAL
jgi:vacuolar-type H+-ATPase subunit I/STV1